ncbi:hypothetical protein [Chitinophaga caseinilytica]|uniref:Galectin n=1 Tax=Chitinophaga caseinilytica TaxID=2267521 RepID=A0ABZ2YZW3_9BACT
MTTEQYHIQMHYGGKTFELPVQITLTGPYCKISVWVDGTEISFTRDRHCGLRPLNHEEDFDVQFLYQLANEIVHQRPVYN